jgi:hypothetical protein
MKFLFSFAALSAWYLSTVHGSGFSTCDEQASCMHVKLFKSPTSTCGVECEIAVCVEIDYSIPGCEKQVGSTIDHICTKNPLNANPNQCQPLYPNFVDSDTINNVPDKVHYCVTISPSQEAYFIMGDGGECSGPAGDFPPEDFPFFSLCFPTDEKSYNDVPYSASTLEYTEEMESCSDPSKAGKECIWAVSPLGYDCNSLPVLNYPLLDIRPPNVGGDPHFRTWHGHKYDYHGACDLVLLHSDQFDHGLGMDIHIRTHHRGQYSTIASAALRIGDEILEVSGKDGGMHILNGQVHVELPASLAGYTVTHMRHSDIQQTYRVHLSHKQAVVFTTWRDIVSVSIEHGTVEDFGDAVGMMGDFATGRLLARNGHEMDDVNAFGQEWQVRVDELKLFQTVQSPQHPQECVLPTMQSEKRRRLGEGITEAAAKAACAHADVDDMDACVYDVMATNDVGMAGAY